MINPNINFRMLGPSNVNALMDLKVRDNEEHLIATNPQWISQAAFTPDAVTFGIFDNDAPCGLISIIDPRVVEDQEDLNHSQSGCLYVWRVMVDRNHRGKAIGTAAIRFAQNYAKLIGLKGVSLTTMDLAACSAREFYAKLEFTPTGRRLEGEIELVSREADV